MRRLLKDKDASCRYHRTKMQKDLIIQKLKDSSYRITKQRLMLLDIILEEEFSSCKEICYKASRMDSKVGSATVYRMINTLEEIGAICRKNMYRIACGDSYSDENMCIVEFDDNTTTEISAQDWNQVIEAGLSSCGYLKNRSVRSVIAKTCECEENLNIDRAFRTMYSNVI